MVAVPWTTQFTQASQSVVHHRYYVPHRCWEALVLKLYGSATYHVPYILKNEQLDMHPNMGCMCTLRNWNFQFVNLYLILLCTQVWLQVQALLQPLYHWKNSMTSLDRMREGETVCMIYLLKMAESIVKSLGLKSPLLHLVNTPNLITLYMTLHN